MKICLDAGHYAKYNRSPAVPEYYESQMNWKLHNLLKKALEGYGVEVIQTRADQTKDLGLQARGRASKGCDLFLSIHSNAVGNGVNESVDYPVVYTPISGKGDAIGKKLADCIAEVMDTRQAGQARPRKSDNGNWDYYGVIYGATSVGTVGLILEHSFHTNTRSTRWLMDDANLAKLAEAEAAVIAQHYGLKKVAQTPATPAQPKPEPVWYRVQVGAFSKKANALKKLQAVQAAGFEDAFLACVDGKLWRVQVGAFSVKANAERMLAAVNAKGFTGFVTKNGGTVEGEPDIDTLAREVMAGKYGNGEERKQKLGVLYAAVQERVNELANR